MQSHPAENYILVVPFYVHAGIIGQPVTIFHLHFWYNDQLEHPINEETIQWFLLNAAIFGAAVHPHQPEKGCSAVNGDPVCTDGQSPVWQICYKGSLIYCRGAKIK
jgi:hypothetical protein